MERAEAIKIMGAAMGLGMLRPETAVGGPPPQAQASRVISVREMGAVGDGRSDDSAAFERAAAQLASLGGGVLDVPPGTYAITTLWLRSNTWLRGGGVGRSILLRGNQSIASLSPATNVLAAGSRPGSLYGVTDGARDIWITDCEVNANAQGQTTWDSRQSGDGVGGAGIDLRYVGGVILERVYVHHAITEGIRLWMCPGAKVHGCRSAYNGIQASYSGRGNGFNVQGDTPDATNAELRRFTTIVQCEADHNGDEGFEADLVTDLAFIGCMSHHNGWSTASTSSAYGFELTGGERGSVPYPARVLVLGCMAEENVRAGSTKNAGLQANAVSPVQQLIVDDLVVHGQTGRGLGLDLAGSVGHIRLTNVLVDAWGAPGSGEHGILIEAGAATALRDVVIANVSVEGVVGNRGNGISFLTKGSPGGSFDGLTIRDCQVDGAGASGIALFGTFSGFAIEGCAVRNCGEHGIYLYPNGAANSLTDGTVSNCTCKGNTGAGVILGATDGGAGAVQRVRVGGGCMRGNGYGVYLASLASASQVANVDFGQNSHNDVLDAGRDSGFQAGSGLQALPYGATIRCNALAGEDVEVAPLTGDAHVDTPSNPVRGLRLFFHFAQDGTGGRRVTWDTVFRVSWSDAGNAALRRSSVQFRYDGSAWVQVGPQSPYV